MTDDDSDLNSIHTPTWRRTSPIAISYFLTLRVKGVLSDFVNLLFNVGGPTAIVFFTLQEFGIPWQWKVFIAIGLSMVFQLIVALCSYWRFKYRIGVDSISVRSGIFEKQRTDVPWLRIRSVNVHRSAIDRVFKLSRISIDTVGTEEAEVEIPGLRFHDAENLIEAVEKQKLEHAKLTASDMEDDVATAVDKDSVAKHQLTTTIPILRGTDLMKATLCSGGEVWAVVKGYSMLSVLYIVYRMVRHYLQSGASLGWIPRLYEDFLNDLMLLPDLFNLVFGIPISGSPFGLTVFFLMIGIALALLFVLYGYVRFITTNANFVLGENETEILVEKGLFSRSRITVKKNCVQEIAYSLNLRERVMNRGRLSIRQSHNSKRFTLLVPFINVENAEKIRRFIYPTNIQGMTLDFQSREFQKVSIIALYVGLAGDLLIKAPLICAGLGTLIPVLREFWWAYVSLIPIWMIISNWLSWTKSGYIIKEFSVTRRSGLIGYSVKTIHLEKVQNTTISQSLIQRIRGSSDLIFSYLPGRIVIPFLTVDFSQAVRSKTLHMIQHRTNQWQ